MLFLLNRCVVFDMMDGDLHQLISNHRLTERQSLSITFQVLLMCVARYDCLSPVPSLWVALIIVAHAALVFFLFPSLAFCFLSDPTRHGKSPRSWGLAP